MDGPSGHQPEVFSLDRPPLLAVGRRVDKRKTSFILKLRAPKNYPQQFANCRPFADAK